MKKIDVEKTPYYQYVQNVLNGKQVACKWVRLACERWLRFYGRPDLEFRPNEVQRVFDFIAICRQTEAPFTGQPFKLMPWQKWVISAIYGFYYKGTDDRVTKMVYLEVGRKQAKTTLIALLALYELCRGSGHGGQIITAANSRQQSGILLEKVQHLCKSIDPKQRVLKRYRNTVNIPKIDSKLFNVAAEASTLDGFSCSMFIVDECHEAKDDSMTQILQTSQGIRHNPLGFEITTAGLDKSTSYGYQRNTYSRQVLEGKVNQDNFFCAIYTIDDDDDPWDEKVWVKCCPGIGVISDLSYMRDQAQQAKTFPTSRRHYLVKLCNIWQDNDEEWIPSQDVLASCVKMSKQELFEKYKGCTVTVGADFSSVSDLSTLVYWIYPNKNIDGKYDDKDGRPIVFADCYVPHDTYIKSVNKTKYDELIDLGILHITPQNTIDMNYIINDMVEWNENFEIYRIYFDKYCSHSWEIQCRDKGIVQVKPFSQGLMSFSAPTKTLEQLVLAHRVRLVGSPLWTWVFSNVTLKVDHNFNVKPVKSIASSEKKIDPIIGAIEGIAVLLDSPYIFREVFGDGFVVDSAPKEV